MFNNRYAGISLQQINVFITAARYENFRKAAEETNMTQASVSRNISLLEEQTGIVLFVRHQKRVRLTNAGKQLAQNLSRLQDGFQNAIDQAFQVQKCEMNRLSIGDYDTTSTDDYLLPVMEEFEKLYPDVVISVVRRHPQDILAGINENKFDLAFALSVSQEMFKDPDTVLETFREVDPKIVISSNHCLYHKEDLSYRDLLSNDVILLKTPLYNFYNQKARSILKQYGFSEDHLFFAEDPFDIGLELKRGNRIAILDQYFSPDGRHNFRYVDLPDCREKFGIQLVYSLKNTNPNLKAFLNLIKKMF